MKIFHYTLLFSFLFIIGVFHISAQEKQYEITCIAFYNLENLFDTIDQENVNDAEFLPQGKNRWTGDRYWEKIHNMARAISRIGIKTFASGPAILGVSEIENRTVLEDLVKDPQIKDRNYQIAHVDGPDRRGVDCGLLYNPKCFKLDNIKSVRLFVPEDPDFKTRDQLVVSGKLWGEDFSFIVMHWPSRSGGEARSRPKRIAAAELARQITDSLLAENPNRKVVLMGDLNDNPTDISIKKTLGTFAKQQKPISNLLFNPADDFYKKGIGSNAYRDTWSLFDQIIMTQNLS
ncbi:MAG: endonuclease/exonuclease/phosphatase family protein, partial [Bacteroidales bacterium]|nr:endonuclease/exonuclease/phosphatase family protein [Bacteroidales bacterium]